MRVSTYCFNTQLFVAWCTEYQLISERNQFFGNSNGINYNYNINGIRYNL